MAQETRAVVIHAPHDLRVDRVTVPDLGAGDVAVKIQRGGICGSDLHYYHEGGFGTVRLKEPMVLGHEISGTVSAIGTAVKAVKIGDRVAVNPSLPCGVCRYCAVGVQNHCLDMRFYGSAMRFPHVHGGFREMIVCTEAQAVPCGQETSHEIAAFAEPLAVCLHAVRRAGPLAGKRVLVTGCGPIGALTILAARHAGAREIVATDVAASAVVMAEKIGADRGLNVGENADALALYSENKGYFDAAFEASGNASALRGAIAVVQPRGRIVQIGVAGDVTVPLNVLVAKEIELLGTFRFHEEFAWAVELLATGKIDVRALLSATFTLDQAMAAFDLASDRSKAMKVQLAFN